MTHKLESDRQIIERVLEEKGIRAEEGLFSAFEDVVSHVKAREKYLKHFAGVDDKQIVKIEAQNVADFLNRNRSELFKKRISHKSGNKYYVRITPAMVLGKRNTKEAVAGRQYLILVLSKKHGINNNQIAKLLNLDRSSITHTLRKIEGHAQSTPKDRMFINKVKYQLL